MATASASEMASLGNVLRPGAALFWRRGRKLATHCLWFDFIKMKTVLHRASVWTVFCRPALSVMVHMTTPPYVLIWFCCYISTPILYTQYTQRCAYNICVAFYAALYYIRYALSTNPNPNPNPFPTLYFPSASRN